MRKVLLLLALPLGAYSMESLPRPADPYVGVDTTRRPYKNLVLAVVKTKAMQANARQHATMMCYGPIYTPWRWYAETDKALERAFGKVIPVERPEDARNAKADLIAILDHTSSYSCKGFIDLSLRATLLTLDERRIDEISNTFKEKGHGLFTYFFLRGLKERGGDFRAAFEYLKPEVSKAARRDFNANQTPQWLGQGL